MIFQTSERQQNSRSQSSLTVKPCPDCYQDDGHAPVAQEGAETRGVAISDLLEGQLVIYGILNDHNISLLQNTPHTGPVTVQQVLRGESRRGTQCIKKMQFFNGVLFIKTSPQNNNYYMFRFKKPG